jgi:hypothetical protein
MVFLGYILPKEQQTIYNKDTALALKNYKNDIASRALVMQKTQVMQAPAQVAMQVAPQAQAEKIVKEVLDDIISKVDKLNLETVVSTPKGLVTQPNTPVRRQSTSLVEELKAKLASPKLGLSPKKLTVDTTTPDIEVEGKPSPTETVTTSLSADDTWSSLLDKYSEFNQKDFNDNPSLNAQALNLLKSAIDNGEIVYGINGPNQKKKKDEYLLGLDIGNGIIFKNKTGSARKFNTSFLGQTIEYNRKIQGQGVKKTGVRKYNSDQNFGKFNLSLKALRKGNLTIYRPSSNHVLINRKNISPRLIKMINEIREKMKFELEDYDNLKKAEQMVIDQIINLLRMTYPEGMRRALDESNWNLRQRYEILIGELNAGNDGKLVKDELKDVLFKLKENKVITKRKHDFIVNALG